MDAVSDDVREKVAQAIYEARYPWTWSSASDGSQMWHREIADAAVAAHLSALGDGGYAVVKLPERVDGRWTVDSDDEFEVSRITLIRDCDGAYVNGAKVYWGRVELNLSGKHARALAGAVLAAAEDDDQ